MPILVFGLLLLAAASCRSIRSEERAASIGDDITRVQQGRPISRFVQANSYLPARSFDIQGGRVFVFEGRCWSWWYTRRVGSTGTFDDFEVTRVKVTASCEID